MDYKKYFERQLSFTSSLIWCLKITFHEIPFVFIATLLARMYSALSPFVNAWVLGILIVWVYQVQTTGINNTLYPLSIILAYSFTSMIVKILENIANNLTNYKSRFVLPNKLLFRKLDKLPISTIENPMVQNVLHRYPYNSDSIFNINSISLKLISLIIGLIATLSLIFTVIPYQTITIIFIAIFDILLNNKYVRKLNQHTVDFSELSRITNGVVDKLNSIDTFLEIRTTNSFEFLNNFFLLNTNSYFNSKAKIYKNWSVGQIFIGIFYIITTLVSVNALLSLFVQQTIPIERLPLYITGVIGLGGILGKLSVSISDILADKLKITEIRLLFGLPERNIVSSEILNQTNEIEIEFKDVSFSYPESEVLVLKNLSFKISSGEKVALVGENGAGKTTIVRLLSKMYSPTSGKILVNGRNLEDIGEEEWNSRIGLLFQDFNKYEDLSLAKNVALSKSENLTSEQLEEGVISDTISKEIQDSLALATIDTENEMFSKGIFTILSETYKGGVKPSGGQWQKIALARFFYKNTDFLILDEPTSAIDAIAEKKIFENIFTQNDSRTILIIAHKFSVVRNAGKVLVLENGEITESGTHEELINVDGKYKYMFETQAIGYK